ncbi:hypothetical protein BFW01_g1685 [Lasiodiplodia theobromae]|nr:hypothetical protein BFW01_g1685 [Lasiodiplodia theobromae]
MTVPGSNINTVFIPSRKGPRAAQELQGAHTRLHLVDFILQQGHRFRDRQLGENMQALCSHLNHTDDERDDAIKNQDGRLTNVLGGVLGKRGVDSD